MNGSQWTTIMEVYSETYLWRYLESDFRHRSTGAVDGERSLEVSSWHFDSGIKLVL